MNSIIDLIYLHVSNNEEDFFTNHHTSKEEYDAYTKIHQVLTRTQQEELDEYQELFSRRHAKHERDVYFQGFKMGAKLILELIDRDVQFHRKGE